MIRREDDVFVFYFTGTFQEQLVCLAQNVPFFIVNKRVVDLRLYQLDYLLILVKREIYR